MLNVYSPITVLNIKPFSAMNTAKSSQLKMYELNPGFIPAVEPVSFLLLWLSVLMILLYTSQLDKIIRKTMHADDRGYLEKHKDAKKEAEDIGGNGVRLVFDLIKDLIAGAFKEMSFWGIIVAIAAVGALSGYIVWGAIILVLAIVIYTIYRIAKDIKILKDYTIYRDLAGTFVALIAGIVLLICDPAGDEFYYFAAIACAAGVGLTAIFTMKRNNELVTRPLPHFFERKAGGKS